MGTAARAATAVVITILSLGATSACAGSAWVDADGIGFSLGFESSPATPPATSSPSPPSSWWSDESVTPDGVCGETLACGMTGTYGDGGPAGPTDH